MGETRTHRPKQNGLIRKTQEKKGKAEIKLERIKNTE